MVVKVKIKKWCKEKGVGGASTIILSLLQDLEALDKLEGEGGFVH